MASDPQLPPLVAAAYLVVTGEQNPAILDEFLHSYASLRRFHPDLPVFVYHANLTGDQLTFIRRLRNVMDFSIGIDGHRFMPHRWRMKNGLFFPQLRVLAAKIDTLLLSPGDTLFLDTDTEVRAPLDEVFASPTPWMHDDEGLMRDHERDLDSMLASTNFQAFGWRGDLDRLRMFNSGTIWVPQDFKAHLYRAKEFLWSLVGLPAEERGDNRLDEQLALSIALEEACNYSVKVVSPRVYHFWMERYENEAPWYEPRFRRVQDSDGRTVLIPPSFRHPEVADLLAR